MKALISITVFIFGIYSATAQINSPTEEFALPVSLSESSGAIYFSNKLITHNDSGGNNELYEVDLVSGLVTRTVIISNATNVDWEDITQDDTSIYIGDVGNNFSGNRTDLKIYKISKADYLAMDAVTAETISFSYSDQTDFTALSPNSTVWDAETLVSFDENNLILFTKNWVNEITKGYLVPKTPGTFSVTPLPTTLNNAGLISGGTYNPLTEKLYLVGYNNAVQPFLWKSESFTETDVFSGTNTQTPLFSLFGFEKIEAITFIDEKNYVMLSEELIVNNVDIDYAKLISFSTNDMALSVDEINTDHDIVLYPNPVSDILQINTKRLNSVEIYDTKLTQLYHGFSNNIDLSYFNNGVYIVKIKTDKNLQVIKKIMKK